jgi:hypothetical protein
MTKVWYAALTCDMLAAMPPIRICAGCEQSLTAASDAMRRHAQAMQTALSLEPAHLTDEELDQYKIKLIDSFNEAQSAWDAYRAHLREHGILPVIPSTQT